MFASLLMICFGLCSIIGFINVAALWRDRTVKGVSIVPACVFLITSLVEVCFYLRETDLPYLALGAALMALSNLLWITMAVSFRARAGYPE